MLLAGSLIAADNDSRVALPNPGGDGSSTARNAADRVITGGSFAPHTFTLTKKRVAPATFDANVSGDLTSSLAGARQAFNYDAGPRTFTAGLSGSTATVNPRSDTLRIDETDLTSAGAGRGSADGDDVVTLYGAVLSHAQPSFVQGKLRGGRVRPGESGQVPHARPRGSSHSAQVWERRWGWGTAGCRTRLSRRSSSRHHRQRRRRRLRHPLRHLPQPLRRPHEDVHP